MLVKFEVYGAIAHSYLHTYIHIYMRNTEPEHLQPRVPALPARRLRMLYLQGFMYQASSTPAGAPDRATRVLLG